jgi:hypothetical protein
MEYDFWTFYGKVKEKENMEMVKDECPEGEPVEKPLGFLDSPLTPFEEFLLFEIEQSFGEEAYQEIMKRAALADYRDEPPLIVWLDKTRTWTKEEREAFFRRWMQKAEETKINQAAYWLRKTRPMQAALAEAAGVLPLPK